MKRFCGLLAGAWLLTICCTGQWSAALAVEPAELVPEAAVFYAEIAKPAALLERAYDPALVDRFRDFDDVQKYLQSNDYKQLRGLIAMLETRLAVEWQPALADLLGGGIYLAGSPQHEAVLLIVRSRDAALAGKLNEALIDLIKLDTINKGGESPVTSTKRGDVTIWSFGKGEHHALSGDLVFVSNRSEAIEAAIDRLSNADLPSLADVPEFKQAQSRAGNGPSAWGMARLARLRAIPKVDKALTSKSNNPVAELLLAGLIEAFRHAPYAMASLDISESAVKLKAEAPLKQSDIAETRSWYFSPAGSEQAPAPLAIPNRIAAITAYRDVAGMWQERDELFDDITAAKLGKADTDLGLFFAGRDFETEVLGELAPRSQFLVAQQEYAADRPVPAIKVPAFAAVMELKNPQEFGTMALVAYQKVVGIYNIAGGQAGKPPLLLTASSHRGVTVSEAVYPPMGNEPREKAGIHHNFSPSCALVGNRFIIGSTAGIVRQTIDALQDKSGDASLADNVRVAIDATQVADTLNANRDLLISQNMLEHGNTREEASQQVDLVLGLVRLVGQAQFRLSLENDAVAIEAAAGRP